MEGIISYNTYEKQDFYIDYLYNIFEGKKFYTITYGCQMNERDSENINGIFNQIGAKPASIIQEASIILFNTCAIRENAEDRFFGNIGALKKLSGKNKDLVIIVCGCMMQQKHIVDTIVKKYPHVNVVFGTHNIYKLPELLYKYVVSDSKNVIVDIYEDSKYITEGLPSIRKYSFKSFVNITYGCNNFCTYCIVPYTRGREKSRNKDAILNEIRAMANNGVKEVTLLGQNVNSYGNTFSEKYNFSDLLNDVNKIDGIERIRFMTSHPKDISAELINSIKSLNKVCESLHLPIQSGNNEVLKKMNRKYTREHYLDIIYDIKDKIPDIAITTDFIVGFPGETEENFEETIDIVQKVEFDSAFIFLYSERNGTKAQNMKDKIDEKTKKIRFNRLLEQVNNISKKNNKKFLNTTQEVLVEGFSKNNDKVLTGRNRQNKLINFEGNPNKIGDFEKVLITKTNSFSLFGKAI